MVVGQAPRPLPPGGGRRDFRAWTLYAALVAVRGVPTRHGCWEKKGGFVGEGISVLMILPQVHLRKPCYDFSFLEMFRFK